MHSCRSVVHTSLPARSVHTLVLVCFHPLYPLSHLSNGGCWEIDAPGARGTAASPAAKPTRRLDQLLLLLLYYGNRSCNFTV